MKPISDAAKLKTGKRGKNRVGSEKSITEEKIRILP